MADFRPSYQDYLQFGNFGGSENAGTPGTAAWWSSLTPEQQFQLIGGNLYIHQGDPRYQGLADATHTTSGSDMVAYGPQNTNFNGEFVNRNNVNRQGGATITPWDNHTPLAQYSRDNAFPAFLIGALGLLTGGLAAGSLGGVAGAAGDSMGAAAGQGFGTALGEGAGAAGSLGGAAGAAGDESAGLNMNYPFGGGDAGATGAFDVGGSNGFGGSTALSGGDVMLPPPMENFTVPTTGSGAMNTAGLNGVMSGLGGGGILSSLFPGGMTASNLLRLGGAAYSLSGLIGGGHGGSGGGGGGGGGDGGGGGKGGGGQGLNLTRGAYTPNPVTQQQLANFRYAQPTGLLGRH